MIWTDSEAHERKARACGIRTPIYRAPSMGAGYPPLGGEGWIGSCNASLVNMIARPGYTLTVCHTRYARVALGSIPLEGIIFTDNVNAHSTARAMLSPRYWYRALPIGVGYPPLVGCGGGGRDSKCPCISGRQKHTTANRPHPTRLYANTSRFSFFLPQLKHL